MNSNLIQKCFFFVSLFVAVVLIIVDQGGTTVQYCVLRTSREAQHSWQVAFYIQLIRPTLYVTTAAAPAAAAAVALVLLRIYSSWRSTEQHRRERSILRLLTLQPQQARRSEATTRTDEWQTDTTDRVAINRVALRPYINNIVSRRTSLSSISCRLICCCCCCCCNYDDDDDDEAITCQQLSVERVKVTDCVTFQSPVHSIQLQRQLVTISHVGR